MLALSFTLLSYLGAHWKQDTALLQFATFQTCPTCWPSFWHPTSIVLYIPHCFSQKDKQKVCRNKFLWEGCFKVFFWGWSHFRSALSRQWLLVVVSPRQPCHRAWPPFLLRKDRRIWGNTLVIMAVRKTEVCLCSNNLAVSTSANTVTSLQFSLLYVLCHPTIFTLIFSTDLNLLLLLYSSVTPMPRFYSLVWKDCTSCLVVPSATQSVLCSLQTLAISCSWLFHFIARSGKPSLENGVPAPEIPP